MYPHSLQLDVKINVLQEAGTNIQESDDFNFHHPMNMHELGEDGTLNGAIAVLILSIIHGTIDVENLLTMDLDKVSDEEEGVLLTTKSAVRWVWRNP